MKTRQYHSTGIVASVFIVLCYKVVLTNNFKKEITDCNFVDKKMIIQ